MIKHRYLALSAAAAFVATPAAPMVSCSAPARSASNTVSAPLGVLHGVWGHKGQHAGAPSINGHITGGKPSPTPTPTAKPTVTPTSTPTGTPTGTPTPKPTVTPTGTPTSNNIVPARGALMGAYVNPSHNSNSDTGAVLALESAEGRKLDVDHHYTPFTAPMPSIYKWDADNGRIPMMSWAGAHTTEIAAGKWDSTIVSRAKEIKAIGKPFLVRFMWEMDGAPNEAKYVDSSSSYIASWRRIVTIFKQQGATNAQFVWCPTAYGFRDGGKAASFYPGDAYVDWVAADGYNWAPGRGSDWKSFQSVMANFYAWAHKNTPTKPLLAGETGVQERNPGDKAAWLAGMGTTLQTVYPQFKAIIYFDSAPRYPWWLDSSSSAMSAWRGLISQPYFNTRH